MRLRLGRPDLTRYADRFHVPAALHDSPISVTFLGVSTLLVDDGESPLLTDGFFSRPSLLQVATRPLTPSTGRIDECLRESGISNLTAVIPVHGHFDHGLDSATVAERTGARLAGGRSVMNLGRGHGLSENQLLAVGSGDSAELGGWTASFIASRHCPPDRYPGEITEPVRVPARASAYRCGEAWSLLLGHRPTGRRLLIQGSAGFVPGALDGQQAEVVYLGVGQLGLRPPSEIAEYWTQTVRAVGARRVVLIHWDDFFRPLDQPLRALPYAGDDLDVTMSVLAPLADADGVDLALPGVWLRQDPWRELPQ